MKVGVPKEVKNHEYRVAITPAGAHELVMYGHEVYVQQDAGTGSSIPDADFVAAGATILPNADAVWQTGDLILKVKEPVAEEYHRMRKDQVLFTYLHLAASRGCTDARVIEYAFSDHYTAQQKNHLKASQCNDWQHCIRSRMFIDDIPFGQPLCARGCNIFHAQGFEHGASCDTQEGCPADIRQRQYGQEHVFNGIPKNVKAPI